MISQVDLEQARREGMRWLIILTLNNARPLGHFDAPILTVVQSMYQDATLKEVRGEIDYLALRNLVTVDKQPRGTWKCALTRYGVDIAEYTIDCEPGIARPEKYW